MYGEAMQWRNASAAQGPVMFYPKGKLMKSTIALAAALLLAGCNPAPSTTSQTTTSEPKTKLVYIPKNTGNPYFNQVIEGFKQAAPQDNIEFDTQAPAKANDPTNQIPIIKDQV